MKVKGELNVKPFNLSTGLLFFVKTNYIQTSIKLKSSSFHKKKGLNEVVRPCHFGETLGEWWTGKINSIKECRHKMHQPKQLTNHRVSLLYNKLF